MEKLIEEVRQIAYGVHVYLGNGYLEKVYENCLRHRLEKAGYKVEAQKRLAVRDEDGYLNRFETRTVTPNFFPSPSLHGCPTP